MTTPANLTYANIETRVANQLRTSTGNATELTKIAAVINEVYRDIYARYDWWWALKTSVVNTTIKTSGSVSVTLGSTSVTFSTALGAVKDFAFLLTGNANDPGAVYRISTTSTAATAHQVDAAITGATSTSAAYRLYEDKIALPTDCGKVIQVKVFGEVFPIKMVGPQEMAQLKSWDTSEGRPHFVSVYEYATTGDPTTRRWLWVHPYPDKAYRMEILYKQQLNTELSSTTQPFIPDEYRQLLIYGALSRGFPVFLNDLERGKFFLSLFNDMMALMVATQREYASDLPQVVPDESYRRMGSPRRRGRVSLGSYFDRWPVV